ncbi:type II toxin-antitoxin system RelE/ParE family toxin [Psychromarinibacter sp. C21-152]|uniref:Toxin n=1 Tax=Psychromarinibacter sediminicola TaxID=3033385 RepID=A0AAE3NS33_9RHOB|nr:type II toxin-antitoxin system RelE/ParE family toxin [Psychromarinibacter sediminicola]MDF0601047.1 type II toxin-antitoxin system RelE/ParE family toxin [Psychromarinibacter sediminicola]
MARVVRRPEAREDLVSIYLYIEADSSAERAVRYLDRIERKLSRLARSPLIGTARLPSRPDLRMLPAESHIIIYRPIEDGIELIRILHARRDWMGMLSD